MVSAIMALLEVFVGKQKIASRGSPVFGTATSVSSQLKGGGDCKSEGNV